jgi:hypothetical protein
MAVVTNPDGSESRGIADLACPSFHADRRFQRLHGEGNARGLKLPACLTTVNIFVAILVRNEIFLNVLYRILVKTCCLSSA